MTDPIIRPADVGDAPALAAIYGPYVENTAVTYEYEPPTAEEFARRVGRTLERYPYLVAEGEGKVLGYAYAAPFHERAAAGWAVEVSIYICPEARGLGLGRRLYEKLEACLKAQNILTATVSIVTSQGEDPYLTGDSISFHRHMGYTFVGDIQKVGRKFGRWYGLAWMEKYLGEHGPHPAPVVPFPQVRDSLFPWEE